MDRVTERPTQRAHASSGPTVAHVMTVAVSTAFLRGQASFVRNAGFTVHAITSPGPQLEEFGRRESVSVHPVAMTRRISPVADLVALYRLCRLLRSIRPEIVHTHTAKGGMLGLLAAWLSRTPVRVYHLRGLRFGSESGARAQLLRVTDRISCALAHRILAVSESVRAIAVAEGLCPAEKITVIAGGSGNGVDTSRFAPRDASVGRATRVRLRIPEDARVVGFVGRLARDKGIVELARAWGRLRDRDPAVHLLVVGPLDPDDPVPAAVIDGLRSDPRVHLTGAVRDTPPMYAAMDVLALPTYREGFSNVALEAAAMGLPVVATRVPGSLDAVQDGRTGTLIPPQDAEALLGALEAYLADPALRERAGKAGRLRAVAEFQPEAIWEGILREYATLLSASASRTTKGRPERTIGGEEKAPAHTSGGALPPEEQTGSHRTVM
jgi:glycosyltransferase involved in cell wall biosynthesis